MAVLAPAPTISLSRRSDVSFRRLDWTVLFTVAGLCAIGLTAIYSATGPTRRLGGLDPYYYVQRQGLFMGGALLVMALAAVIDYRRLRDWALFLFGVTTILLIAVTILARSRNGIRAWFVIGPFQLQPSELAKVTLILVLAAFVASDRGEDLPFPGFVRALGLMALPVIIVIAQRCPSCSSPRRTPATSRWSLGWRSSPPSSSSPPGRSRATSSRASRRSCPRTRNRTTRPPRHSSSSRGSRRLPSPRAS
jgi:hypothetical protein